MCAHAHERSHAHKIYAWKKPKYEIIRHCSICTKEQWIEYMLMGLNGIDKSQLLLLGYNLLWCVYGMDSAFIAMKSIFSFHNLILILINMWSTPVSIKHIYLRVHWRHVRLSKRKNRLDERKTVPIRSIWIIGITGLHLISIENDFYKAIEMLFLSTTNEKNISFPYKA